MNENIKNVSYGKVPREVTLKAGDRLCSQIHLAAEECRCFPILLLFSYDETPWPRQLTEGGVCLVYGSRGVRVCGGECATSSRLGGRMLRVHILNPSNWKWGEPLNSQRPLPFPVTYFLQQGRISWTSPNSATNWAPRVKTAVSMGAILIQNTTLCH